LGKVMDPKGMGTRALHDNAEFRSSTTGKEKEEVKEVVKEGEGGEG